MKLKSNKPKKGLHCQQQQQQQKQQQQNSSNISCRIISLNDQHCLHCLLSALAVARARPTQCLLACHPSLRLAIFDLGGVSFDTSLTLSLAMRSSLSPSLILLLQMFVVVAKIVFHPAPLSILLIFVFCEKTWPGFCCLP